MVKLVYFQNPTDTHRNLTGAHPGHDDVKEFESVGMSHHVLAGGLSLQSGQLLYVSVKGRAVSIKPTLLKTARA